MAFSRRGEGAAESPALGPVRDPGPAEPAAEPGLGALRPSADSPWETWGQHRDVRPQEGEEEKRKRKQGENSGQKDWLESKKRQDA